MEHDMKEFLKTHKHMWWGLYFVIYLACYFLVEAIVPTEGYHIIYSPLDDLIPFCEYFIIFYYIWYLFLGGTALYLMFCDGGAFRRYMWFLILGFSFSLIFYLIYPNGKYFYEVAGDDLCGGHQHQRVPEHACDRLICRDVCGV